MERQSDRINGKAGGKLIVPKIYGFILKTKSTAE